MHNTLKITLTLLLASSAFAQTGQLCFRPDKTAPARVVCRDLAPGLLAASASFIAATGTTSADGKTFTPTYQGVADLMFSNLSDGLFTALLAQFPPPALQTPLTAAAAQQANATATRQAIVAKTSVLDPP